MAESKMEQALDRARGTLANIRAKSEARSAKVQRLAVGVGAAYLAGAWEKQQHASGASMPTIAGLDYRLTFALAAYIGGEMIGGRNGELLEDAGFGILCAYAHRAGQGEGTPSGGH